MSTNGGDSVFPKPQPPPSGLKTVLQYTGIPPSWLDKRPGLPSRNWIIFLTVTSAVAGCYLYDRHRCKEIRQEYVDKVKHLSRVPLHSMGLPRKVMVYGSKWPGDEEYQRSMQYFRRYVKPVLVAAAIDYEMVTGRRHGDIAERIANEIKSRRRLEAGLEPPPFNPMNLPSRTPEAQRQRELEGGIVLVGRSTFKEFMAGLKRGWTESLEKVDKEEKLANVLSNDGRFDEVETEPTGFVAGDDEPIPTPSKLKSSMPFSPAYTAPHLQQSKPASSQPSGSSVPPELNTPPSAIPPHPPILQVSFLNYIGLSQIPLMIWDFFNERHKVRAGAEDAYRLVVGQTRPMSGPSSSASAFASDASTDPTPADAYQTDVPPTPTDVDFDKDKEAYYKNSMVKSFLKDIEKARENYYSQLPQKLEVARALARGTREPTKEETNYPPPTEVELRAERLKKELRWRGDEKGWEIVRPDSPVAWDERFNGVLHVIVEPSAEKEAEFRSQAQAIMDQEKLKEREQNEQE